MKSVLLKRVPKSVSNQTKNNQYSKWGSEAYLNQTPRKEIALKKANKVG